jgi:hypothetical protein
MGMREKTEIRRIVVLVESTEMSMDVGVVDVIDETTRWR